MSIAKEFQLTYIATDYKLLSTFYSQRGIAEVATSIDYNDGPSFSAYGYESSLPTICITWEC